MADDLAMLMLEIAPPKQKRKEVQEKKQRQLLLTV